MRSLVAVALLALLVACGGPTNGRRVNAPTAGPAVATALASEPGGIIVLANGRAGRGEEGRLATSPEELASLWADVGLRGSPPKVDFATHVVLGTNFEDGVCQPELVAAHIDAAGTLTFRELPTAEICIALAVRVARVVAVPRRILPPRFTWNAGHHAAYAFELAPTYTQARASTRSSAPAAAPTGARDHIASPRGVVALPPAGHIALRELPDGRQIWVAHRSSDDITVLLADRELPHQVLHGRVMWNAKAQRFWTEHDSRGRSLQGDAPLERLAFARVKDNLLAIGEPVDLVDGPVVAREAEPVLEGPADPYALTPPSTPVPFASVPDGHFGVVNESLVAGLSGPLRLCVLPTGKLRAYSRGCPDSAPVLVRGPDTTRGGIDMQTGPLVVHRQGNTFDVVIDLGSGNTTWVVEQPLPPPAPRGPGRSRGRLPVGGTVKGSTAGSTNSIEPTCAATAGGGAPGGPDESWDLVVGKTGTYVIELRSTFDGVLAVVAGGKEVACNDDRHGHHASSVLQVELAAGTPVHVIVDGFGGFAGSYELTVREAPALAKLVVGGSVSGTTTGAVDQEAHGCYAPAGDHRYTLVIEEAGAYAFRVTTPGWTPMLSVLASADGNACYTTKPPLVDAHYLKPGRYFVVIDGSSEQQHGPYTLSVERCGTDDATACRRAIR